MANKRILSADVETKGLMTALKIISKESLPKAVAETLNITADMVTKQQIANVKSDFVIRTNFTLNSMKSGRARPYQALNKAKGQNLQRMFSRAGTFSKYLWLQENNQTIKGLRGPIPMATRKARISKSQRKAIRKVYRIDETDALKDGNYGSDPNIFIGKAGKSKRRGMYKRMKGGKITALRSLDVESAKIKGTGFHSKAVKRKGNNQLIVQRFKRIGQKYMNKAVRRG